ncbi:hypothetical protein ACFO0S_09575 [Chryseomicrobium palamuruense]|uniref:Uncharacterized protein n=1 Tax=Chryseomicrobium palamuruense TaxID=682973 RepID=A0ABV8UVG5_9BACL
MKDYGKVKSTVRPEPLVIDEESVWVYSDIVPVEEEVGEETFTGFEFSMVQYEKDEYIKFMQERNANTESTVDSILTEIIPSLMM